MRNFYRKIVLIGFIVFPALLVFSASTGASGFQTSYHSVSSFSRGLGGAGVSGDDLADFYYNPAGLSVYSPGNYQASLGIGKFSNDFVDKGSSNSLFGPSDGPEQGIDETLPNFSGQWVLPNFLSNDDIRFGIFIGNAFGNEVGYDDDWIGRYHATVSSLRAWDISPTMSFPISKDKKTQMGIALSIQYSTAEIGQALFIPTMSDGHTIVDGDSTALGYAIGLTHEFDNATLGISFRSKMEHDLEGDLTIKDTPTLDGKYSASAKLVLPETVYLSAKFAVDNNKNWNMYWTSRWTNWSRNEELRIKIDDPRFSDSVTPQDWNDTWLHGLGVSYQYSPDMLWRVGFTVDQTPIPSAELRTPRQPEGDRKWISFGFSRTVDKVGVFDVGINHQIIDDGDIDNTRTILESPLTVTDNLKGTYEDGSFTLLGIQYRRKFQ